jgi:hypothetical protein
MHRVLILCWCHLLLVVSQAVARGEYRLGGGDGNAWKDALSLQTAGAYLVFDDQGQQVRAVPVGVTPHGAGIDTLIDFSGTLIQPRFIDPAVNMTLTDPASSEIKIPLPYTGGEASVTDGCSAADDQIRAVKRQFDGDLTTAHFRRFTQSPNANPGIGEGWGRNGSSAVVVNFGAAVPVNRIRFYPRLGRADDALLIQELRDPQPEVGAFGEDSFAGNFLAWYEIRIADNTPKFARGPCDLVGFRALGLRWITPGDPLMTVLQSTRENLNPVIDLRFPARSIRWITIRPFPLRDWEIAEFEVYGEGFVEETVFITQILDFGKPINWGKIRWSGKAPQGTRVEIRTRTGQTPDPNLYFARNINGDIRQIALAEYENIDPTGRLPTVYDADNWSFWSPPYDFAAGLRNESFSSEAWKDGTPLLSPGPSRYIQVAIRLFATFTVAPRLDQFVLQFGEAPAAREVLGEIWPIEVESFGSTAFTYVVRPSFDREDTGFDRLEVLTHVRADSIHSVSLDGLPLDLGIFPPEVQDDRLIVSFPRLEGEGDSFKQLEVNFSAPVLRFGTEFVGWVFDSQDPDQIKQQVRPGNATFRFSGDVLAVNTPVGGNLLVEVELSPNPFTPNGDGLNETVAISYKLREVTAARPVSLSVFDLAGRQVIELLPILSRSGEFTHRWDGRDGAGRLVPPGTYVYRLHLDAEEDEDRTGLLSVIY